MSAARSLIVTGATGKQGGALIRALLAAPTHPFEIYAVTRNTTSSRAAALASKPKVRVIQGDFSDPAAIFAQVPKPWGVFSVTNPMNAKVEEQQGKAMTAAAVAAGVQHIVFTATDRGAQGDTDPTIIPHFASKYHIERDIVAQAQAHSGVTWTFLRPAAFFENMSNDFLGKIFDTLWRDNPGARRLQLISTTDIGTIAAEAFLKADAPEYRNQSISLAGDDLTYDEAERVFKEVTGKEMITTYGVVGSAVRWLLHEQLGIMFGWFATTGFAVDVAGVRKRYPFVKDFRTWLKEESAWRK